MIYHTNLILNKNQLNETNLSSKDIIDYTTNEIKNTMFNYIFKEYPEYFNFKVEDEINKFSDEIRVSAEVIMLSIEDLNSIKEILKNKLSKRDMEDIYNIIINKK